MDLYHPFMNQHPPYLEMHLSIHQSFHTLPIHPHPSIHTWTPSIHPKFLEAHTHPWVSTSMADCRDFNYSVLLNILHLIRTYSAPPTSAYLQPERRLPHMHQLPNTVCVSRRDTQTTPHLAQPPDRSGSQQANDDPYSPGNRTTVQPTSQPWQCRALKWTVHSRHSLAPRVNGVLRPISGSPTTRTSCWSPDTHTHSLHHQLWHSFPHA